MRKCHYLMFSAMVLLFAPACDNSEDDASAERGADIVEKEGDAAGHHGKGQGDGDCQHKGDGKGPCDCKHKDGEDCPHKGDGPHKHEGDCKHKAGEDCPHKHAADGKAFVDADGDGECDHHAKPAEEAK